MKSVVTEASKETAMEEVTAAAAVMAVDKTAVAATAAERMGERDGAIALGSACRRKGHDACAAHAPSHLLSHVRRRTSIPRRSCLL